MSRLQLLPATLLMLCLAGCVSLKAPERFLVIEEGLSDAKAVSPDDARLWIREFDDEPRGDLRFWSEVLHNELVKSRGYTLISRAAVQDARGREGHELLMEVTVQGITHRLVTIYVTEGWASNDILTARYIAPRWIFDGYLEDVRESFRNL